jgi:hypothetical protein
VLNQKEVTEAWYSIGPADLPMTGHYTIQWAIKSGYTTPPSVPDITSGRTLTIINNGVGTVTVDGVVYTSPITYSSPSTVNIQWTGKADVEVTTVLTTKNYYNIGSISVNVVHDTTVTLTPAKKPICEYSTI